jgi:serine/threonine protein kinase/tetratricopeptide (TPR) repeat protein
MIGTGLGPYEIIEKVGAGAMATVYRAYHPSMDRYVAVKVIDASLVSNEEAVARFQREARLIARLEHLHILPVYDFDGAHVPPYIVMRYLEGGTIRDVLAQGPLPLDELVYLIQQIGSALHYAHRQGIVHRDVKPANVLIDTEGNAFVSDFGIARIVVDGEQRREFQTMTGSSLGTPGYMAPEQIRARGVVDERADVYALGAMLYEMVTGALPFRATNLMEVLHQHLNAPVPDARALRPELPPALNDVIQRAMAKAPGERYPSSAEFAAATTAAIGSSAATPSAIRSAARESKRRILERRDRNREKIEQTMASFREKRTEWQTPDSEGPPSEHNRNVTALSVSAAEYAAVVEDVEGAVAAREAIDALWGAVQEAVGARDGQVYSCTEDSMLALWGAGEAHEDDPENAIRAALDIQSCLQELGEDLLTRASLDTLEDEELLLLQIGINSGVALMAPSAEGYTVSGATISLAHRVALRSEGEILITHDTYRGIQGVFDMQVAGPLRVRGRRQPLLLYTVTAEKQRAFRRAVRDFEGVETQMVGRRAELQILQDAFGEAIEESETQVVTIIGEAGIGKSRLLSEFDAWADLHPVPYRIFQGRATTNMARRPYALLRDLISFRFEILDSDPFDVIRAKLEDGVGQLTGMTNIEMSHLVGYLCGFDFSGSERIKGLLDDPQQLTSRARQWLKRLFVATSALRPVVIQLEDIHHADDASLDLLNELVTEHDELRLLLVCVARPTLLERRPAWGSGQEFHLHLTLQTLTRRESRLLVREILQRVSETPKALRDLLVEHAEGNPFYMEELVRMLIEDRVITIEPDDAWRVETTRLENLRVPPSLDRLLQVRFDTLLYPEKVVLERAAVVGRTFYDSAIEALSAADHLHLDDLDGILRGLVKRGFVHVRETSAFAGHAEFTFDQQMMRDSIYEKLLRQQAREYHAAVASWLVDVTGERVSEYYALIAERFEKGNRPGQAAHYLRLAGTRSFSVGDVADAQSALERALSLLPEDKAGDRLPILLSLGEVLNEAGDLSRAASILTDALGVARVQKDAELQANALYQLAQNATRVGDWDVALRHLDQALGVAWEGGDRSTVARVLYGLGDLRYRMGQPDEARRACDEALAIARAIGDRVIVMNATNRLGTIASLQGDTQEAMGHFEKLLALAREAGALHRECSALNNMGEAARIRGDFALARQLAEEALAIAREIHDWLGWVVACVNLTRLSVHAGRLEDGRSFCSEALSVARRAGSATWLVAGLSALVQVRVLEGWIDEALALLGLVWHHPAVGGDVREDLEFWVMPELEARLTPEEIEAGMTKGQDLDPDDVVDAFLGEASEMPRVG